MERDLNVARRSCIYTISSRQVYADLNHVVPGAFCSSLVSGRMAERIRRVATAIASYPLRLVSLCDDTSISLDESPISGRMTHIMRINYVDNHQEQRVAHLYHGLTLFHQRSRRISASGGLDAIALDE